MLEDRDQGVAHAGLIVNHQHGGPVHRSAPTVVAAAGRVSVNELPAEGVLSTVMVPPWASMTRFVTARPRPIPRAFLVKNGVKILSRVSSSMPMPVSVTVMCADPGTAVVETVSMPPPGIES